MDESERSHRSPSWGAIEPPAVARSRPILPPHYVVRPQPTSWLLNMLFIVVLCIFVMGIASAALRQWRPSAPESPIAVIAKEPRPEVRAPIRAAQVDFEKLAHLKAARETEQRRAAAVKERLVNEEAARQATAREAQRESGWQVYYKKPDYCDEAQQDIDSVGCANDYIRQRRAYDEQFSSGRI